MRRLHLALGAASAMTVGAAFLACGGGPPPPANSVTDAGPCELAMAAGAKHACALSSGVVRCWGDDTFGQLGFAPSPGSPVSSSPSKPVSGFTAPVANLVSAAGGTFNCALLTTGAVECWGSDDSGQLGATELSIYLPTPSPIALAGPAKAIAAGSLDAAGFDCAEPGTLGNGLACALLTSGAVQCWGAYYPGDNGPTLTKPAFVPYLYATAIAVGGETACALVPGQVDGQNDVACFGVNSRGQLGGATTAGTASPVPVTVAGLQGATAVAVGDQFACAIVNGSVYCWGDNSMNQLGNPALDAPDGAVQTQLSTTPQKVANLTNIVALVAGGTFACAEGSTGTLWCWGANDKGQLGGGTSGGSSATPVEVQGVGSPAALAAGEAHVCTLGLISTCWGDDTSGQLGNARSGTTSATPVTVPGVTTICTVPPASATTADAGAAACTLAPPIAAGAAHTCAIVSVPRTHPAVSCWGDNSVDQLGTTGPSSPTPGAAQGIIVDFLGTPTQNRRRHRRGLHLRPHHPERRAMLGSERGRPAGRSALRADGRSQHGEPPRGQRAVNRRGNLRGAGHHVLRRPRLRNRRCPGRRRGGGQSGRLLG